MSKQNFANHIRYYPPHHFVFYPLLLLAIALSGYQYTIHADQHELWLAVIALFLFTGWASYMMRQHYALGNQDRIVRLEMEFRYYVLTGKKPDMLVNKLHFRQLAALRFASDEELAALVDRTLQENLSPEQIKQSIQHWKADHMRV